MKHSHWTYKPTEPSWGPHVSVYNWICIYTHVYIYIYTCIEREREREIKEVTLQKYGMEDE